MIVNNEPVIIIAAARSGTKMLRDVLGQSEAFVTFPYDMNYVWLYGNYNKKHDELHPEDLTPEIHEFIKARFAKILSGKSSGCVLEKTVPNSLRVSFVKKVFPRARIIHLYRNGFDVTADAMQCWQSSLFSSRIQKKSDLIKKVLNYPYLSSYSYLYHYLVNYLSKFFCRSNQVQSWGPRYKGIDHDVKLVPLEEVCALQWKRSVDVSMQQLSTMREGVDYIHVEYEKLVTDVQCEIGRILSFLDIHDQEWVTEQAVTYIRNDFIGYHRNVLDTSHLSKITPVIQSSLSTLGYQ